MSTCIEVSVLVSIHYIIGKVVWPIERLVTVVHPRSRVKQCS